MTTTTDRHAEARELYQQYLERAVRLKVLRAHARAVIAATGGSSQTPVQPLATMGTGGGPLLCDVCRRPMPLERGGHHNVDADVAWKSGPRPGWTSYIRGGMLLVTEINGTLRVYHGHASGDGCVGAGDKLITAAREAFQATYDSEAAMAKLELVEAYLRAEIPDQANDTVLTDIHQVMFRFDPGPGVNLP